MPTPTLRELQEAFWEGIAGAEGPAAVPALLEVVEPAPRLTPQARIAVYADMYRWRLVEALREDYPKLAAAMGCEPFTRLVHDYITAHPSRHPSLRQLGGVLADFLGQDGATPGHLGDLARLEWARVEAFDAPDVEALTLAELRQVPPERWPELRFRLVPGVTILRSRWPIQDVWHRPDDPPPVEQPTILRVWRQGFRVYHAPIALDEDAALAIVGDGGTFAEVCELRAGDDPEAAVARAGSLLARWLEDGLLLRASHELVRAGAGV